MKKFFLRVSHWPQGLAEAKNALLAGKHRHDVLEEALRAIELDAADDSTGYGGIPNILGKMELDAAFMDGNTRQFGAVGGVEKFLPIRIARSLMEREKFHTLLVGQGAEIFARECGLPEEPTLSPEQEARWKKNIEPLLQQGKSLGDLVVQLASLKENFDTSIMVACDGNGFSAAATTSGWGYKYPGRLGDTPVAGAGMYVDSRFGAAFCTYTGEMAQRAGTARYVVAQLEQGKSVTDAVRTAAQDAQKLQGGVIRTLVIHAATPDGSHHAAAINAAGLNLSYRFWMEGMADIQEYSVEKIG